MAKHVVCSSTGSPSVLTIYMQLSRNKKRNARRLYIKRARNRITRFFIVLKFIWDSKTVTVRSFWQENGRCSLNDSCVDLCINILVIFCKIYGANVARNYLYMWKSRRNARFAVLWSNWSRYSHSQSAQASTCIDDGRRNCAFITLLQ